MATLKIGDQKVKVDDSFLSLPKDQQQAVVNRIAASLQAGHKDSTTAAAASGPAVPPVGLKPGTREYADWAAQQARAGKTLPQVSDAPPDWQLPDTVQDVMPAPLRAWSTHTVQSVPVAGALIEQTRDPFMQAIDERAAKEAPGAAVAGDITGPVLSLTAASQVPVLSTLLGLDASAPLLTNMALGGLSQAGLSRADAALRGEDPNAPVLDLLGVPLSSTDIAAAGGVLGPLAGKVIPEAAKGTARFAKNAYQKVFKPGDAAQRIIGNAVRADIESGQPIMSAADEAIAAANGQPLINADRAGANVRTLARTAANLDPAAKAALHDTVQDRFLTQSRRAIDWIQRNTGAPTDVYAARQALDQASTAANRPAYRAAYTHPDAHDIFTPEISDLMGSDDFQKAIKKAVRSSNNAAATAGNTPIKNPFVVDTNTGRYRLRMQSDVARANLKKAMADGDPDAIKAARDILAGTTGANDAPMATPSLEFWDHVQRQLRQGAESAARRGKNFDAAQYYGMRSKLLGVLDSTVPEFQTARHGAAAAFGAEDALEAGQKFLGAKASDIPAMAAAHGKFSPAEKRLFASGFASSLIDKVSKAPETSKVINSVFSSPQAKAQIRLALGDRAADELEHFLRIENIMHLSKQAVQGGSNTAAQLAAMGALGAAGGGLSSGDVNPLHWLNPSTLSRMGSGAVFMMAGRAGAKALGKAVDQKVMQSIAKVLSSNDPAEIQRAVKMARQSNKSADAIKAIEHGLTLSLRGSVAAAAPAMAGEEVTAQ